MQLQPNVKGIVYLAVFLSIPMALLVSLLRAKLFPVGASSSPDVALLLSTGVVAFLVSSIVAAVYRFLWRLRPTLFGVEDLNGRWEGWYYRSHTNDICPTAHEILQQTPLTISVRAWGWRDGQVNTSSSRTAAFSHTSGTTVPTLIWPYQTDARPNDPGGVHDGTHIMTVVRSGTSRYLYGEYYNNRHYANRKTRGAWGVIRLKYTPRKPLGYIGFNSIDELRQPNAWAIADVPEDLVAIQRAMSEEAQGGDRQPVKKHLETRVTLTRRIVATIQSPPSGSAPTRDEICQAVTRADGNRYSIADVEEVLGWMFAIQAVRSTFGRIELCSGWQERLTTEA